MEEPEPDAEAAVCVEEADDFVATKVGGREPNFLRPGG